VQERYTEYKTKLHCRKGKTGGGRGEANERENVRKKGSDGSDDGKLAHIRGGQVDHITKQPTNQPYTHAKQQEMV
jgi:hypothetical protein